MPKTPPHRTFRAERLTSLRKELNLTQADALGVSVDYLLGRTDERHGFSYNGRELSAVESMMLYRARTGDLTRLIRDLFDQLVVQQAEHEFGEAVKPK